VRSQWRRARGRRKGGGVQRGKHGQVGVARTGRRDDVIVGSKVIAGQDDMIAATEASRRLGVSAPGAEKVRPPVMKLCGWAV
jgi:hypothetical protein